MIINTVCHINQKGLVNKQKHFQIPNVDTKQHPNPHTAVHDQFSASPQAFVSGCPRNQ